MGGRGPATIALRGELARGVHGTPGETDRLAGLSGGGRRTSLAVMDRVQAPAIDTSITRSEPLATDPQALPATGWIFTRYSTSR